MFAFKGLGLHIVILILFIGGVRAFNISALILQSSLKSTSINY